MDAIFVLETLSVFIGIVGIVFFSYLGMIPGSLKAVAISVKRTINIDNR